MTKAETQPKPLQEVRRGEPFRPFDQKELELAFKQWASRAKDISYFEESVYEDPLFQEEFVMRGGKFFYATLFYEGTSPLLDHIKPYAETQHKGRVIYDLSNLKNPVVEVEEFPVSLELGSSQDEYGETQFTVRLPDLEEEQSIVWAISSEEERGYFIDDRSKLTLLVLPGRPELLSKLEIAIQ